MFADSYYAVQKNVLFSKLPAIFKSCILMSFKNMYM